MKDTMNIMKRETRKHINDLKQRVVDFFFVYYDATTSKKVKNHPELAIPLLRETIQEGFHTRGRLAVFAGVLRDAIELERLRLTATSLSS